MSWVNLEKSLAVEQKPFDGCGWGPVEPTAGQTYELLRIPNGPPNVPVPPPGISAWRGPQGTSYNPCRVQQPATEKRHLALAVAAAVTNIGCQRALPKSSQAEEMTNRFHELCDRSAIWRTESAVGKTA
eukprot:CAMPEP_0113820398 /NCGR_PEP_ID=MMETSP0328-20130328/1220_1 /TAXON_ID=39455 /ORGANISM="Alexandrium minutum" /LENGTH=128 /DNA_ID=CAMNT_0000788333 /DNA_START=491 /DNA_END=878 /DNA_ORIENTATION=- /assembly_acc=CAM_ASM_000350